MKSRIKDYLEFHEKKDKHQSDIQFFRTLLKYVEELEEKNDLLDAANARIAELNAEVDRLRANWRKDRERLLPEGTAVSNASYCPMCDSFNCRCGGC